MSCSKLVTGKKFRFEKDEDPHPAIPFKNCLLLNVSSCPETEALDSFMVTVYNPLSRPVSKYVRLPVTGTAYSVKDPDGM